MFPNGNGRFGKGSGSRKFLKVVDCYGREILIFCSGRDFAPLFGNETKIKTSSEIKLPLFIFLLESFINIEKRYKIAM